MDRIQVLLHPEEKETFRRLAGEKGLSLSAWVRGAALKQAAVESQRRRIRTVEALRDFFAEHDAREEGREPEWQEHLEVMTASKLEGVGEPLPGLRGEPRGDGDDESGGGATVAGRHGKRTAVNRHGAAPAKGAGKRTSKRRRR